MYVYHDNIGSPYISIEVSIPQNTFNAVNI